MGDPRIPEPKKTTSKPSLSHELPKKHHYPNPPESVNPDATALREQWRFAIRQYSKWYSHAWGTAILAGLSFFALGWAIKGSNPLPSFESRSSNGSRSSSSGHGDDGDKAASEK